MGQTSSNISSKRHFQHDGMPCFPLTFCFTTFLLGHGQKSKYVFIIFLPFLFLLFLSFCCSDWPSTGLASSSKNSEKASWRWANFHGPATCSRKQFCSEVSVHFWAFSCICQASLSRTLWSGYQWKDLFLLQNLNTDDAKLGQRWWRQKRNKGQRSTRPVTAGMRVNGAKFAPRNYRPQTRYKSRDTREALALYWFFRRSEGSSRNLCFHKKFVEVECVTSGKNILFTQ